MDFTGHLTDVHGVWRILKELSSSPPSNTGFLYSSNPFALLKFVEQCTDVPLSISGCIAFAPSGDDWFRQHTANTWLVDGHSVFYRPQEWDTLDGFFYLGWFELPSTLDLSDSQTLQVNSLPPDFKLVQNSHYIDIYSNWSSAQLSSWFNDNQLVTFAVQHNGNTYSCTVLSPMCPTCFGIHRECPLSSVPKSLGPIVQTPLKHSSANNQSLSFIQHPCRTFTHRGLDSLLVRTELIQSVVDRVLQDKFVLIEAPPCSGKSILLEQILKYIRNNFPNDIVQLTDQWHGMKSVIGDEHKEVLYTPTHDYNDSDDGANMPRRRRLIASLLEPVTPCPGRWILLDEAQLTYVDHVLWSALYGVVKFDESVPIRVIAAGSYGSHTGSYSHSPPPQISSPYRMNLFSDGKSKTYLAFTHADAKFYMQQVISGPKLKPYEDTILYWASPWQLPEDANWEPGFHPGVVAGMTQLLYKKILNGNRVSNPYTVNQLVTDFKEECFLNASAFYPAGLGRAIPRPSSRSKFTPAAMQLFTSVMYGASIEVRALDQSVGALVVQNYMKRENNHGHKRFSTDFVSEEVIGLQLSDPVLSGHLREKHPPVLHGDIKSNPEHLLRFIDPKKIALTPRERFLEVEHSMTSAKPFSLRQRYGSNNPLTDYEQAAHDARRMGWLLHDPKTVGLGRNKLSLPTRWHGDYLQHLLFPKPKSQNPSKLTIDQFLVEVIAQFRSSYLMACYTAHSGFHEKVVDSEFSHGAEVVMEDPCFVLPQVHTEDNKGIVDFLVPSEKWLIEVLTEGDELSAHIDRFKPNKPYGRQWPTPPWDWRVIDFRYSTRPDKKYECPQLRTVVFSQSDSTHMTFQVYHQDDLHNPKINGNIQP